MKTDTETLRKTSLDATLHGARNRRVNRRLRTAATWMLPALLAGWFAFRPPPQTPVAVAESAALVAAPSFERVRTERGKLAIFNTSPTPVTRVTTEQLAQVFPDRGIAIVAQENGPSRIEFY